MTTATVTPKALHYDLKAGVRKFGDSSILTEGFKAMVDTISADKVQLVESPKFGTRLQVVNTSTEQYFSIGFGPSMDSRKKGNDLIKDLISNYVVYCGVSENGVWYRFGRPGAIGTPTAELTLAELTAQNVAIYAGS